MHLSLLLTPLIFPILTFAQFGQFFEHMFSGGGGSHGGHGHHHREPDAPSDAAWYKKMYEGATCSKYLCPGTLSCVDKPTHCPCAFPDIEEKFELHEDGIAVCLSKSLGNGRPEGGNEGWEKVRESLKRGKGSDTKRKVELARKGLL